LRMRTVSLPAAMWRGKASCRCRRRGVEDENCVTAGGRVERKGVVSLVARRRGRTLCQDVAGEWSRKGPVSLQAARHHLEAEPIQR
jgi:hypothetical protein